MEKIKIFNPEQESTFEFFGFDSPASGIAETDWNGMHQELGMDALIDDMRLVIMEVVQKYIAEEDREKMARYMQKELIQFYREKLDTFAREKINVEVDLSENK